MNWQLLVCSGSIAANLEIESTPTPPIRGYRNNKTENNGNNGKRTQGKND